MSVSRMVLSSSVICKLGSAVIFAMVLGACESKQEESPKSSHSVSSSQSGEIELPEGNPTIQQLETDQVAMRSIQPTLKAQGGKVLANDNRLAHLSGRVPGRIVAVYANLGDRVKEGDQLLLLDSPAFGEAQLEFRKARTMVGLTKKALERAQALFDRGAIGAGEYQRREAEFENARADLHEAEEKLHLLGMTEREIGRLAAKKLPHAEVAQVSLRAPFNGEVIERNATVGEIVDPNKTLFTVADLSTVWVRADFPEQQAARLKTGLDIELKVSAYPDTVFHGTITYVAAVIDPSTRTVMARSDVQNPDGRLRPEMFADITMKTETETLLTVPRTAVQQVGSRTLVFVKRAPRRFEPREVTVGESLDQYVQIKSGLKAGETIVTRGSYALKSESVREQMPTGGPL